jgi:hypothetical protein
MVAARVDRRCPKVEKEKIQEGGGKERKRMVVRMGRDGIFLSCLAHVVEKEAIDVRPRL